MYTLMLVGPIAGSTDTIMLMAETLGALRRMVELKAVTERLPTDTARIRAELDALLADPGDALRAGGLPPGCVGVGHFCDRPGDQDIDPGGIGHENLDKRCLWPFGLPEQE